MAIPAGASGSSAGGMGAGGMQSMGGLQQILAMLGMGQQQQQPMPQQPPRPLAQPSAAPVMQQQPSQLAQARPMQQQQQPMYMPQQQRGQALTIDDPNPNQALPATTTPIGRMFTSMGNSLSNAGSGLKDYMSSNPDQMALMLDAVGSRLAPNNMFAGIGTQFAKSRIANRAAQSQQATRQQMIDALNRSYRTPVNMPQQQQQPSYLGLPPMTPKGEQGETSRTINHDGTYTATGNLYDSPVAQQSTTAGAGTAGSPPPTTGSPQSSPAYSGVGGGQRTLGNQFINANPW